MCKSGTLPKNLLSNLENLVTQNGSDDFGAIDRQCPWEDKFFTNGMTKPWFRFHLFKPPTPLRTGFVVS